MCEFCHKHGEGKKWYLEAKNYSLDLLSDLQRRNFYRNFFEISLKEIPETIYKLERFKKLPFILKWIIRPFYENKMKKQHYGQIVPLEDIKQILQITNLVVAIPCVCRKAINNKEERLCLAISTNPLLLKTIQKKMTSFVEQGLFYEPVDKGIKRLTQEETIKLLEHSEKKGMVHSIWTFGTPFIGGLCNCTPSDCLAFKSLDAGLKFFFKGEYKAYIDNSKCKGCKLCIEQCHFNAIGFDTDAKTAYINFKKCYGCGICRSVCNHESITLKVWTNRVRPI